MTFCVVEGFVPTVVPTFGFDFGRLDADRRERLAIVGRYAGGFRYKHDAPRYHAASVVGPAFLGWSNRSAHRLTPNCHYCQKFMIPRNRRAPAVAADARDCTTLFISSAEVHSFSFCGSRLGQIKLFDTPLRLDTREQL